MFFHFKLPWSDVKTEMVEEKGLDTSAADKIGEYVKLKGGLALVDQLTKDEQLYSNKSAKAGIDDIKLLLEYIDLFGISDKVMSLFTFKLITD